MKNGVEDSVKYARLWIAGGATVLVIATLFSAAVLCFRLSTSNTVQSGDRVLMSPQWPRKGAYVMVDKQGARSSSRNSDENDMPGEGLVFSAPFDGVVLSVEELGPERRYRVLLDSGIVVWFDTTDKIRIQLLSPSR